MHLGGLVMPLKKIKLFEYIELYSEKCNIPDLTNNDISGINKEKEFFEPSNQVGTDTSGYKIVPPKYFACNLMHVGRDVVLPIAYNHSKNNKIVSPAYFVFRFKENVDILNDYFFIYLKSKERDRYFWFNTDSSIRDGMSWDDFINIELKFPPLPIQQKYVDIYKAMVENQQTYEHGLDDLKLVCDAYIEDLRRKMPCEEIGPYIQEIDNKNTDLELGLENVRGISIDKKFIPTKANMDGVPLKGYKIVAPKHFAYVPVTSRNGDKISFAHNYSNDPYLVSSTYTTFYCYNSEKLLPEYLCIFFNKNIFDEYARYNSWGSAREIFLLEDLKKYKIPIPDTKIQQSIVNIYNAYNQRKEINEKLKAQIKEICPILIKGSIEEAKRTVEV